MTVEFFTGPETTPIRLRGLHLDPSRHFIAVETVLRIIDKMAALRLNALHLHLSDDQSIPIELACAPQIRSAPRYSIADQERIALACRARGIEVIPEIDVPGHARLLSFIDPEIKPERRMGVITPEMIDLDRDLPMLLAIFAGFADRFDARRIHVGGDEAHDYGRFPELIDRVCAWAAARGLDVIAWDDALDALDRVPANLIIQRWRRRADPKIAGVRTIQSRGFYLDHAKDPFTYYDRPLELPAGDAPLLGCVACMWTELVTDATIERTIFPSLYMLAHRWWTYPSQVAAAEQPALLRALCERFGFADEEPSDAPGVADAAVVGFYRDDPRSTSSVTVDDVLDRPHDLVPTFSRDLVLAAEILRRLFHGVSPAPSAAERGLILDLGRACYGEDLTFLFDQPRAWRNRLHAIIRAKAPSELVNNGLEVALRLALK